MIGIKSYQRGWLLAFLRTWCTAHRVIADDADAADWGIFAIAGIATLKSIH